MKKTLALGVLMVSVLALGGLAYAQSMHRQAAAETSQPTTMMGGGMGGMYGGPMWPMGPGRRGQGPIQRHHAAMMQGIPEPYASMTNPLPLDQATLKKGAQIYATDCQACHGSEGQGDGPAGASLSPPPGNLAWLSDMPMGQWDAFIYWSVAEGGGQFGTAMPAFKDTLSKDDIWAVTAYIQAHLPREKASK